MILALNVTHRRDMGQDVYVISFGERVISEWKSYSRGVDYDVIQDALADVLTPLINSAMRTHGLERYVEEEA